jgi:hypothetical protein
MDLSTVQLSFKEASGAVQQSRLDVARAEVLTAGRPWRVFRWHRGQAHYSGWHRSATMGRHVVYESRLELARLLLADFDGQVAAIAAQPFLVTAPAEDGRSRRHVPDFLLVDRGGLVTVVSVKPADRLGDPKVARSLEWAGTVYASRGWRHEIWSQAPPAVLANVRSLAAYRHQARVSADLAAWVDGRTGAPVSVAGLEAAWPEQAAGIRSAALHLLWRGALTVGLPCQPRRADGELWAVAGMDGEAVTLRGRAGRSLRVRTATLPARDREAAKAAELGVSD